MKLTIPVTVQKVMDEVRTVIGRDAELVLVGGPVRDIVLGADPKDFDFATPLLPQEVETRIQAAGKHAYGVGKRFGTVGFRLGGHFVEVTTYRSELYDEVSRKPQVTFTTDLNADLSRRDFTMNAMALTCEGELIDPFGGLKDLQRGCIRAVGAATNRFREDPLRMLRMIRFAARYDFEIEEKTAAAAEELGYRLLLISSERIAAELDGIVVAPHAKDGFALLAELGLLGFVLPFLAVQDCGDHRQLWSNTLQALETAEPEVEARWAALLGNIGKPFVGRDKLGRDKYGHHELVGERLVHLLAHDLKWSNQRRDTVAALVRYK